VRLLDSATGATSGFEDYDVDPGRGKIACAREAR